MLSSETADTDLMIDALMEPEEPTRLGPNVMTVSVWVRNEAAVGANLAVVATMPGHGGHGTNEVPVVDEVSAGIYEVTNLVFTMPGTWQIEVQVVTGDGLERSQRFEYTVR